MSLLEALFLGILQGATEFLPVSSSGHLVLLPAMFGLNEPGLQVVSIAHLGTLLAVMVYFYKDLWEIAWAVLGGLRDREPLGSSQARIGWFIVLATIPAVVLALLFQDWLEEVFATPTYAAMALVGTAALLLIGEYLRSGLNNFEEMSWLDALVIGLFQAGALFPGISRSGSTIVGGLVRGLNREMATRFSFLMSVPVILGAGLLSLFDLIRAGDVAAQAPPLLVTFIAAAVVGYACIHLLLQWVRQRSLVPFAVYCASLGFVYLLFF